MDISGYKLLYISILQLAFLVVILPRYFWHVDCFGLLSVEFWICETCFD